MMAEILKGLPNVQNYLDDIIVCGCTPAEHDHALTAVLRRLQSSGLKLNPKKCHFRQTNLRFLDHTVTAQGIHPDQEQLAAIRDAPVPDNPVSLRSFLGLLSWYDKFLPNYATVVEPLHACLRETDFKWTDEAQSSFLTVKNMLLNSPTLALFDPNLPTVVSTDASDYGLGALLTQIHPDHSERTVAFASRKLTPAERKYSTVEKEALGCVWAVEKWRTYLWGHRFTLKTDHQALTTILTTKGTDRAGMRVVRWSARLMCFDYDISYRVGVQNHTADCLSHLPLPTTPEMDSDTEPELVALLSTVLTAVTQSEFEAASSACPEMTALRNQITRGWPPSAAAVSPGLKPYYRLRNELTVKDSMVFRGTGLVVPIALHDSFVVLSHESHQGIVRSKQCLRDLYWWPCKQDMVSAQIAAYQLCQNADCTVKPKAAPIQPVPFPDGPWRKLALDIAKMKAYTDTKRGARTPSFKEGDKVCIRKRLHVPRDTQSTHGL
ncbi:hypothetical protein LDENG_00188000 [Lucifuga dentata]|nr:hypothetical protein LDENG_00188000 [Lucifuga dentata]